MSAVICLLSGAADTGAHPLTRMQQCEQHLGTPAFTLLLWSQERTVSNFPYTSGYINSAGKFTTQYGRIEMRAKVPAGHGIWPAFWMMPSTSKCWPTAGEIDIMELQGSSPATTHGTLVSGSSCNVPFFDTGVHTAASPLSDDFHVYAVEWEESQIRYYLDDLNYRTVNVNIPQSEFFVILNTAVGGNFGPVTSATQFPTYYLIDYVRVYKAK